MNNKRTLFNLYKDIVLVTRVRIFCTPLFTNNNTKIVIQMHTSLMDLKMAYWHGKYHYCTINLIIFSNIAKAILNFFVLLPKSYCSSNFLITIVIAFLSLRGDSDEFTVTLRYRLKS